MTPSYFLNGQPVRLLGLSDDTESMLSSLGITTLEQLAQLALNPAGLHERAAIEAIRTELAGRLSPYSVQCLVKTGVAAHFIIHADNLFFFKASIVPEDPENRVCTYQWQVKVQNDTSYSSLQLFHLPPCVTSGTTNGVIEQDVQASKSNLQNASGHLEVQHSEPDPKAAGGDDNHQAPTSLTSLPALFESLLTTLNPRERMIIERRYGLRDGVLRTPEQVGEEFNYTRVQIQQIEQRAFQKIRTHVLSMQHSHQALENLISALEQSHGILPITVAVQQLGLASMRSSDSVDEARLRFLCECDDRIGIPKDVPVVALRYTAIFDALPGLVVAIQTLLRKASRPLSAEEIFATLASEQCMPDVMASVPRPAILVCLNALPRIAIDEQGRYFLKGRTFNESASVQSSDQSPMQHPEGADQSSQNRIRSTSIQDSYDIWNHAIATYVTAGVQRGSVVYLNIDDDVILQIRQQLQARQELPPDDFLQAVKRRVVRGRRVELKSIYGRDRRGEPKGIAFLAAMVLAASRMAWDDEDQISSSNYFTRLCEVLDIDQDEGRPLGMRFGSEAEEPLWREWAIWLSEKGLISTARPGEGAKRYINYPISQTILRRADRDRLIRLFYASSYSRDWDIDKLLRKVRDEANYLTKHLRMLLADRSRRAQAIAEAIYEVYQDWASGDASIQTRGQVRGSTLYAGLWRSEDVLTGVVEYFLYPRSPRHKQFDTIIVDIDSQQYSLIEERPGWYQPICTVTAQHLNQGVQYPIKQPAELLTLVLPRRDFWILVPDPDNPESGIYASWGTAPLGTSFIILCRRELLTDLERLRAERLIEWKVVEQPSPLFAEWVEVRNCMVLSPTWDGVEIEHRDLHEALRPRERLSIGLAGGLRAPRGGWLVDLGPSVTIFGFPRVAEVRVVRMGDSQIIIEETKPTNQSFAVVWSTPGDYIIEAVAENYVTERLVKIVDWDELEAAPEQDFEWPQIGEIRLAGALIRAADEEA
ncbi:MAG: hypothetical protein K6356_06650 [Chloroflexus sp.]